MDPKRAYGMPTMERKEPSNEGWSGGSGFLSNFYAPSKPYFSSFDIASKIKEKDKGKGAVKHIIHYPDGSMYELTSSGELKPIKITTESTSDHHQEKVPPTVVIIKVPYPIDHHHHRPPRPNPRPYPYYPSWHYHQQQPWYDYYYGHYDYPHYHSYRKRPYVQHYQTQDSSYAPGYNYQSNPSEGYHQQSYGAPSQQWYGQSFGYGEDDNSNYYDGGYSNGNSWWPSDYGLRKKTTTTDSKTKKGKNNYVRNLE